MRHLEVVTMAPMDRSPWQAMPPSIRSSSAIFGRRRNWVFL